MEVRASEHLEVTGWVRTQVPQESFPRVFYLALQLRSRAPFLNPEQIGSCDLGSGLSLLEDN